MPPCRARAWTACTTQSGDERTNHEATVPIVYMYISLFTFVADTCQEVLQSNSAASDGAYPLTSSSFLVRSVY